MSSTEEIEHTQHVNEEVPGKKRKFEHPPNLPTLEKLTQDERVQHVLSDFSYVKYLQKMKCYPPCPICDEKFRQNHD